MHPALAGLAAAALLLVSSPGIQAQSPTWTGRLSAHLLSVDDAGDWIELSQGVGGRWPGGQTARLELVETRRFGQWDTSVDAGGTVRPAPRWYLSFDGRITPGARILEDVRLGGRAAVQLGAFVPSLGYRFQAFDEGDVHSVIPRLEWYRGPWLLSGEFRVIRSAVETVNLAAIGRVSRRLEGGWRLRLGIAGGEEDFLVGPSGSQALRTLSTRSLFAGAEREIRSSWTLRVDLTAVDSDPRLSRIGGSFSVTRRF